jgi:predicted amidohydrolase
LGRGGTSDLYALGFGPMRPLDCAVIQLCSTPDVKQNLSAADQYVGEAARAGARFVSLPENAAFLQTEPTMPAPAQSLGGSIIEAFRKMASDHGVWLLVGSFPESREEDHRYYNTSVVIDGTRADAPITSTYRKLHLFDIDMKGGESQKESDWIAPGDQLTVAEIAGASVGLSICYDLRFPELYRRLTDQGARVLTVPSAFTEHTGKDHWLTLLRARAIENQSFVIAPNQFGHHGGKRRSYGKSAIIDPWGLTLALAPDRPGWAMARIDFEHQDQIREALPCLAHRNPNV